MQELMVDFITSLDGYGAAEGWPGWWGLQGPEYLAWLEEDSKPDYTTLMGANTYRVMFGFTTQSGESDLDLTADEDASVEGLTKTPKVVFSSTLEEPLSWANSRLVRGDAVEAVRSMKQDGTSPMRTLGSLTLCRSLLEAGLVDRFRVGVFPVITGLERNIPSQCDSAGSAPTTTRPLVQDMVISGRETGLMSRRYHVTGEVEVFPQPGGWHYMAVPRRVSEELSPLAKRGLIPITATTGSTNWSTSLLPKGDGSHFIALSAAIRRRNVIEVGDEITVTFQPREEAT